MLDDAAIDILPDVATASMQAVMADVERRVSCAAKTPDVTMELMYSQCGPVYADMVSLNVPLPTLWDQKNRQDREVSAKLVQANVARARAEVLRHNMVGQILGKRETLRLNQRRLGRYQTMIVSLVRIQTEATLTSYRTGSDSPAAVAKASRRALDLALERSKFEASTAQPWAELVFLKPFPTANQPASNAGVRPRTEPSLCALQSVWCWRALVWAPPTTLA